MFTGIVQDIGIVTACSRAAGIVRLSVKSALMRDAAPGDSIAINGVCLTVRVRHDAIATFDAVVRTQERTTVAALRRGQRVNVEPALKVGDKLGGHFLYGHVDGIGTVRSVVRHGADRALTVMVPAACAPFCIDRGSIGIDGVSLTIARVSGRLVEVALIPQTCAASTLGECHNGARVNIECDALLKAQGGLKPHSGLDESFLRKYNYL